MKEGEEQKVSMENHVRANDNIDDPNVVVDGLMQTRMGNVCGWSKDKVDDSVARNMHAIGSVKRLCKDLNKCEKR